MMNWRNQSLLIVRLSTTLFLGGWLGSTDSLLAQKVVNSANVQAIPMPESFRQRQLDLASQPNSHVRPTEHYVVYVDGASAGRLRQVRQLDNRAVVQKFHGRYVIRAGIFNRKIEAEQQVRKLESRGMRAGVFSLTTGQEIGIHKLSSKRYFVVIPTSRQDLHFLAERVRRFRADTTNNTVSVSERLHPLGPHIRVGPLVGREEAERWQRYLVSLGLHQARVYYGL